MPKTMTIDMNHLNHSMNENVSVTPAQLRLVAVRIPLRACEYKISNTQAEMASTESLAMSLSGVLFFSNKAYQKDTLMRVWVEIPNYWARKSRHVEYRHTEAPQHFQILSRVVKCEENSFGQPGFQIFCENLNIDPIDELILQEYLQLNSGGSKK